MHIPDPTAGNDDLVAESVPASAATTPVGVPVATPTTSSDGASTSPSAVASGAAAGIEATPAHSALANTPHLVDANSANDTIELDLIKGFAQEVNWGVAGATTMVIDEPEPLGENRGPSPGRVLAAALASCLGASLLFCLKKSRIDVQALHTTASVALTRNYKGRLRVGTITVRLEPTVPLDQQPRMARCIEVFEDFCIVTASVRPAVTVDVSVHPVAPV